MQRQEPRWAWGRGRGIKVAGGLEVEVVVVGEGVLRLLLDTLPTVVTALVMSKGGGCKLEITAGAVC